MADYNANIKVNVQTSSAEKALDKINDKVSKLEAKASNITFTDVQAQANLNKTLLTVRNLNDAVSTLRAKLRRIDAPGGEGAGKFADKIRVAATQADRFFDGLTTKGTTALAKSTQGLREQAAAFQFLAANIDPAKARFQDYVQGAQAAQDKLLLSTFKTFEALRKLYTENITGRGVDIEGSKLGVGFFEKLAKDVPRTTGAVKAYYQELVRIRDLIEPSSVAGLGIEQEIIRITGLLRQLEQERKAVELAARGPQVNIAEAVRRNVEISRRARAQSAFQEFSVEAESSIAVQKSIRRQREKLGLTEEEFKARNSINTELKEEERTLSNILDLRRREAEASLRARGGLPQPFDSGGVVRRTIAAPTGEFFGPGGEGVTRASAVFAEQQARTEATQLDILRQALGRAEQRPSNPFGFDAQQIFETQQLREREEKAFQDLRLNLIQQGIDAELDGIDRVLRAREKAIKDFDQRLKEATRPREEQEARQLEARKRRTERISNVTLGAGFPLLFGGGPGAIIGGGLGGALGTGPQALAAQIGLSALGQQLDLIAGSTLNTAKSLTSTSKAFELLQEKTLFSSEAAAEKAIQLEAEGKAAELAALLSEELANALGNKAAQSLLDLGKTTDETTRLWNQLTLQLQTLLAGPLNGLLKFVNSLLSQLSKDLRFRELSKDLAGDAEFQAAVQARRGGGKTGVLSSADKAELLELFKGRVVNTVQIPVTAADRRLIAPPSAKSAPKGPKDRTAQLLADLKAIEAISDFENQIRDAQFEYNDLKVIDLQYKKTAADIERDATKQLINANFETEKAAILQIKNAKLRDAELKRLDDIRQLQRDITDEYFRRGGLDTRFLIQREGAGAFDPTLDLDPNDKKIQAVDNLRDKLKDLADPINVAVRGAESIGSAFNTAFNDLISGTTSAQEVLSNFFKSVGDSFVDLAGQIISQLLVISAFKALAGIFGAAGGSLFSGAGPVSLPSGDGFTGAFLQGVSNGPIKFAEGGYVTSPTRAIIGEGGEPEYVIPFSKMGSAAANFAAGARGEDVFGPLRSTSVPFSKTTERLMSERSERETVAALNNPDPLDVRFNSQVINNVEYVTAEEYRKGMAQAAERGRTLTLAALQNSVKTRKRVGIG